MERVIDIKAAQQVFSGIEKLLSYERLSKKLSNKSDSSETDINKLHNRLISVAEEARLAYYDLSKLALLVIREEKTNRSFKTLFNFFNTHLEKVESFKLIDLWEEIFKDQNFLEKLSEFGLSKTVIKKMDEICHNSLSNDKSSYSIRLDNENIILDCNCGSQPLALIPIDNEGLHEYDNVNIRAAPSMLDISAASLVYDNRFLVGKKPTTKPVFSDKPTQIPLEKIAISGLVAGANALNMEISELKEIGIPAQKGSDPISATVTYILVGAAVAGVVLVAVGILLDSEVLQAIGFGLFAAACTALSLGQASTTCVDGSIKIFSWLNP